MLREFQATDELISGLSGAFPEYIVRELGVLNDRRAVQPLIECISGYNPEKCTDKESRLFRACVESLGTLGDRRAVRPLVELLETKSGWLGTILAEVVATALGNIGDKAAVQPLIDFLNRRPEYIEHIVPGLAAFNDDIRIASSLLSYLADFNREKHRTIVSAALGKLRARRLIGHQQTLARIQKALMMEVQRDIKMQRSFEAKSVALAKSYLEARARAGQTCRTCDGRGYVKGYGRDHGNFGRCHDCGGDGVY